MNALHFKGLKLGADSIGFTYLAYDDSNVRIFRDKPYFNKHTEEIWVYDCRLGNEFCEVIDSNKKVLLIRVGYTIDYFGTGRRNRVKDYVFLDNTLYLHDTNIKRVPKEIKLLLEEYFKNPSIIINVNLGK